MIRRSVRYAAGALACAGLAAPGIALAQAWPAKAVRVIVPFPPGGALDFFARIAAQRLQAQLGQQMVVENRSGAGGMIGAEFVARAAPDGYTVLFSSAAEITINLHLYPKMAYDPIKDFAPVSYAAHAPLLFAAHPSVPVKNVADLVALAKRRPGELTYASAGTGGVQHLAGELFKTAANINIVHIPYKGAGPAVIDMVGGQVSMGFTALPSSLPHARTGKLRALAVTSAKRSDSAPDVASFTELGFKTIDLVSWFGVLFPARTPPDIVAKMSTEVKQAVHHAEAVSRLRQQGVESIGTTPEEFVKFMHAEIARYGKVIKESGAKPD